MNTVSINEDFAKKFLSCNYLCDIKPELRQAYQTLTTRTGAGNSFLGWIDLPEEAMSQVSPILAEVERLKQTIDTFVVIGIGGSYLGARAVIEALASRMGAAQTTPRILYAGNTLSEDYYWDLMQELDKSNYAVAVISKSGTTTEPAIAFRIIKEHLEHKYGPEEASRRIIAITDAQKGALHDIAKQKGYSGYVIPDNVGGRFSVLTPVGLLPIAMAGLDITALLEGARDMRRQCLSNNIENNPALQYAALRNLFYQQGKTVEMLVSFEPRMRYISEWWKQLYGESEGKEGKGILPHSLCYTTDLHSLGQYVQEGRRMLFETVLHVEQSHHHIDIPHDIQNLDGLNYLENKTLTEINHQAEQGTILAHNDGEVPVIRINLPTINAYYIGQLLYLFEFACGVSGYLLQVNPFDQPGVEAYKRNMFRLLGKPGYTN